MYKYAFVLEFESDYKLKEEELHQAGEDFSARLTGLSTIPLPYVKNLTLRFNDNLASQNEHIHK